jgi:hypothetical protein
MRDIFVQIGQHQQQVQHPLPLLGNRMARPFLQILDDEERVCQQPFQIGGIQRALFAAATERVIGADQRLVEKMIQTELFAGERSGDRVCTRGPSATSNDARIHGHTPAASTIVIIEARGAERTTVFPPVRKYPECERIMKQSSLEHRIGERIGLFGTTFCFPAALRRIFQRDAWEGNTERSGQVQVGRGPRKLDLAQAAAPWHFLYFLPDPHGQGSFLPTFAPERTGLGASACAGPA